jgi:hypothetical protein
VDELGYVFDELVATGDAQAALDAEAKALYPVILESEQGLDSRKGPKDEQTRLQWIEAVLREGILWNHRHDKHLVDDRAWRAFFPIRRKRRGDDDVWAAFIQLPSTRCWLVTVSRGDGLVELGVPSARVEALIARAWEQVRRDPNYRPGHRPWLELKQSLLKNK